MYQVLHNDSYLFGDITYAKVGNDWAFYVVVNIPVLAGSEILRLPFGGAPATTMATSPAYIGSRDLDTDGANLYWVDSGGLRKVGLNGGTVQTLTTGTQLSKIGGVDSTYIFYSSGVSVRRIAKTGGSSALVAPATTAVTALYLRLGSPEFVFWGESDGSISARQVGGSTTEPIQDPQQGRTATSVAADPTLVFWTDCNTSGTQCRTVECKAGTPIVIESDQTDAFDLHTDAHAMFWSSSSGLIRYTF